MQFKFDIYSDYATYIVLKGEWKMDKKKIRVCNICALILKDKTACSVFGDVPVNDPDFTKNCSLYIRYIFASNREKEGAKTIGK